MSETEFLARLYRGAERRAPGSDDISRRIAALCGLGRGSRVLDLGSGAGPTARLLAKEHGCEVTCVDMDEAALQTLTEAANRDGVADLINPLHADMRELSLPEGGFRCVVAEGSFRFIGKPLAEGAAYARRFLEVNGRLAISTAARVGRTLPSAVNAFYSERGEVLLYPRELVAALEQAGFEPLAVEAFPESLLDEYYRFVEQALEQMADPAGAPEAASLRREVEVFRREGGRSAVNEVLLVARRREPGEKPRPSRGGA
jgi:cyclopropane fatty-acyl-phospholipid synthase-like methyltransferase